MKTISFQYEIQRLKTEVMKLGYIMDIREATYDSAVRISLASDMAKEISEQTKELAIHYLEYLNGIRAMHGAMKSEETQTTVEEVKE